jgi:P-type conjugative transfer protein TrbG
MIFRRTALVAALAAAIAATPTPSSNAYAEVPTVAMPGDNRLVTFVYDANDSYTILTRPRSVTNLALRSGESVLALALGDTTQWMTEIIEGHVFVKPLRENIFTTGTLVTNQRTYQLTLRASPENGKFYQRVSWEYPTLVRHRGEPPPAHPAAERVAEQPSISTAVDITKVRFGYSIKGEAPFRPVNVFDDGTFTYLKLPASLQDMPAVFVQGVGTKALELTNYVVKGEHVIVQRLAEKIVLKLGKVEVEVSAPTGRATRERRVAMASWFE